MLNQIHLARLIIVTPNVTHDTVPISEMVESIILANSTNIKVINNTASVGQGNWNVITANGEHFFRDCEKFGKDKVRYKLKTEDPAKKYKDKIRQAAQKGSIMVNEAAFSDAQELTYSVEQVEQLLGNLQFSDNKSD